MTMMIIITCSSHNDDRNNNGSTTNFIGILKVMIVVTATPTVIVRGTAIVVAT